MQILTSVGYDVIFDRGLTNLQKFVSDREYSQVLILVDRNTNDYCLPILQAAMAEIVDYDIIEIDPGEENKNIDYCIGVWKTMIDFGVDRNALMINLGGGVVTDLGGFVASTYKRGIDFIQIPTTLLAQVDASVGGKTGIDMDNLKNIIGTFTQPQAVFISPTFLSTLDHRQKLSGLAEIIKHGLIYDRQVFNITKDIEVDDISDELIFRSIQVKNEVVIQDPTEQGIRKILNFGHTIGHAIEGYSLLHDKNPLLHGEAIAIGMVCEAYISHELNGLSDNELQEINQTILAKYPNYILRSEMYDDLLQLMKNDKKNEGNKIGFSLLKGIGQCDYNIYVEEQLIIQSLDYYKELI